MNKKTKKVLAFVAPVVIAGVIIVLLNRRKKSSIGEVSSNEDVKPVPATAQPEKASPEFPLRRGSRGEKVKELQRVIGVTADGIFGPNTESALLNVAGVSSVQDQKEFDMVRQKAAGLVTVERAKDLYNKFVKGGYALYAIEKAIAKEIVIDAYGAHQPTGKQISLPAAKVLNNQDYVITGYSKLGNIIFKITKGDLAGTYSVNASQVSLKAV